MMCILFFRGRRWSIVCAALVLAGTAISAQAVATPSRNQSSLRADSVRVAGLRSSVEVRYDRWGVPHIYARNQHDLFFAQGMVAAQDRLFQIEMWRRAGEGRLSEVLGPAAVERDRLARMFSYRGDMAREWVAYAPDTKAIVTAFVAGVNAQISRARAAGLPPEFGMLGFAPEPWDITVPLSRSTGLSGVGNANSEVLRAQLVALLGSRRVDALLPTSPNRELDPVAGMDYAGLSAASLGGFGSAFADVAYNRIEGSNNWVVSGARSVTGRPILANDPHRVITNPAVRYLTHLVAPGWNVIGAGEPASPGVAIGHNDRIAFGLTVVGMDQMDTYVETLGACGGGPPRTQNATSGASSGSPSGTAAINNTRPRRLDCYWFRGAWKPVTTRRETIRVKGQPPRTVILQFTVHGPILSIDSARSRAIAVRSVHSEPGTASYLASLSLGRARDWNEFQSAMQRWLMPSENMIYADTRGNIGWVAGGIMPRRSWSGLLPVPGDGTHEWNGFVPGDQLPRAFNPPNGFIATANNNTLPAGYTIPISYEWAQRYRIDRVRDALTGDRRFSVEDFKRLQHDDYSLLAQALVPQLIQAADRMSHKSADLPLMTAWDFRMSREQIAPTLFATWAPLAYRRIMEHEVQAPRVAALIAGRPNYQWLEGQLSESRSRATDSLLVAAFTESVRDLERQFGVDRQKWEYGRIHVAELKHPLAARYDPVPVSRSGDGNTINATGGARLRQTAGASYREVIDLADFDNSFVTNTPGQSGDPRSSHYKDLLTLWGRDEYFPLVYSRRRVEEETERVQILLPRSSR